ncbi:TM2 domain-containing protein [Boudabousia marimammalium]|uniref:TM2 domain-containing protein n=1 Tax=Boudabousia marimammalium TaxID=156892 RepID=A0A1Q5PMC1_9ACTO|nr:TM2 domain-containing protein [Boudabousia marimammalium]OKL48669.1 hypothetical protein BM477_05575 [Boudabousia marimammalium]
MTNPNGYQQNYYYIQPQQPLVNPKSRVAAGLFGILLGTFGIHNFYLGRIGLGLVQLLLTVLSFGLLSPVTYIWGLIEGILYLASTQPRWSTDSRGIPLI